MRDTGIGIVCKLGLPRLPRKNILIPRLTKFCFMKEVVDEATLNRDFRESGGFTDMTGSDVDWVRLCMDSRGLARVASDGSV